MSADSDTPQGFAALAAELAAAGFRLDWMDEGPVRGEPMFAAFVHPDGRRVRYTHDLITGRDHLETVPAPAATEVLAFTGLGVEARRQVLRWWIARRTPVTGTLTAVLAAALADPDPETRVTAILCALRLRVFALAEAVAAADVPETTADGAFPGDRLLYRRIREVAADALSGRRGDRASALFGALADPAARPEALLLHALTTPLPQVEAPDGEAPDGVVVEDATLRLRGLGAELVWIPPLPHWLGGLRPADADGPTLRLETPPQSTFVTKRVLTPAELSTLGVASDDGLIAADELPRLVEGLGRVVGRGDLIAETSLWSLALHGPDGRLFPWGNALTPAQRSGPWGVYWSETPEWTIARGRPTLSAVQRRPRSARGAVRLAVCGGP